MRVTVIFLAFLAACSTTPDVAITRTEPQPDARVNAFAAQPSTTTTSEPVRVRAAAVEPPKTVENRVAPSFTGDIPTLIRAIWPDDSEETAVRVAWCESRFNPAAQNPSGASGIFQLMLRYHAHRLTGPWYDPAANTRAALSLFSESGWNPWRASAHCWANA